jgi:hypothetical protein
VIDFKRIQAAEVKAAYAKSGLAPARGGYFGRAGNGKLCACGWGAYAAANLGVGPDSGYDESEIGQAIRDDGFNELYRRGFIAGFDNLPDLDNKGFRGRIEFTVGRQDGRAAWEAVKAA